MKKSILVFFFCITVGAILSFAQTVNVETYGVAPRDVARDTDVPKYFDVSYNGLKNVGKEVKVYLEGTSSVALNNAAFAFASKPSGSNATFGAVKNVDTSTQIISFIPDVIGTYDIEFSSGGNIALITINAGLYLGVEGGAVSCKTCHGPIPAVNPNIYDKWLGTGHAMIFTEAMAGTLSDHYGPNCISCHTTGYIPGASNDGFDDLDFVYPSGPDSLNEGTWELLLTNSPEAMKRANIQCESCHGPGSAHQGDLSNSKMVKS